MKYTINKITHSPGEPYCKQGIKKHQYSKFAQKNRVVGGGNGSYIVAQQGETRAYVSNENGSSLPIEIYSNLKEISNGKKFTEKFISDLNSKLVGKEFEVEGGKSIEYCLMQEIKKVI